MIDTEKKVALAQAYFTGLRNARRTGAATEERTFLPVLERLLSEVGALLKPKVHCYCELADQGAGHPDIGLFSARQVQSGRPRKGQVPERGVVEMKPASDDAWLTAKGNQVTRYWGRYGLVLVTNTRDFALVGKNEREGISMRETLQLAGDAQEFERKLESPAAFARETGPGLVEYLVRVLSHHARIADPKDLAWLLASYARDGLSRMEGANDPALDALRESLEKSLGIRFEDKKGERFFQSTLIQTLFYGVFSAWVLWAQQAGAQNAPLFSGKPEPDRFNWREAAWHLHSPVLRALFQQISDPGRLRPIGLDTVLDWAQHALNRVDRDAFFGLMTEGEAVPYFYEPFLQAFDPDLRRRLGVWYTPPEVVSYMVARVDNTLKGELGIVDGLAADNVHVLDPCCGTGAYLSEVLKRIAKNLGDKGLGALAGAQVKKAATTRVYGFEVMPAPFAVAHLQIGLTLREINAPLEGEDERPQIFLTNALTGWEPKETTPLPLRELEEERSRAKQVKQKAPILVILGNPPYNGFADVSMDEERDLSAAYQAVKRVRKPRGRALGDLYVRFFRMAERRITERTGQGIVCFISNYSWLAGDSYTGMRERYLEAFDSINIDCLNGDKYRTGKQTPDGLPDPSIFSTPGNPVSIQVGTAIATLARKPKHVPAKTIGFRDLWGASKREQLADTAEAKPSKLYRRVRPALDLGLPFRPMSVNGDWESWPALPDLMPCRFPGVETDRDSFLVDTSLDRLKGRISDYFNPDIDDAVVEKRCPGAMRASTHFDPQGTRRRLISQGGPVESGFVRFSYRPFDSHWLYWDNRAGLLGGPGVDLMSHAVKGNLWLVTQQKMRKTWSAPQVISGIGDRHLIESGATCVPVWLNGDGIGDESDVRLHRPNLTCPAQQYVSKVGAKPEDLFFFMLACLHDPGFGRENSDALAMDWPRIPLPGWPDPKTVIHKRAFAKTAAHGRDLHALLDPAQGVPGVTTGKLDRAAASIAVPSAKSGGAMSGADFELTAGWGHLGQREAVMPGGGQVTEREYDRSERNALGRSASRLGPKTFDVHINDRACWRNVPANVWNYSLGGYRVLKKWLSYRSFPVCKRPLTLEEASEFSSIARRIATILELTAKGTLARSRTERGRKA